MKISMNLKSSMPKPVSIVKRVMTDDAGSILISILLGLGLAALFRSACGGAGCFVIHGPNPKEVKEKIYKIESSCFKYVPYPTDCTIASKDKRIPDSS